MLVYGVYNSAREEIESSYDGAGALGAAATGTATTRYFMLGKEGVSLTKHLLGANCPKMGPIQESSNPG